LPLIAWSNADKITVVSVPTSDSFNESA
jgi:hypothetical protein